MTVRISNLPSGQGVGRAAFYRRQGHTVITADSYTLTAGDDGRVLVMERETTQVVTVPAGLPAGFGVTVIQGGAATDPDRLIIEGVIGESTLRAQHRVGSAVWSGGPGSQISITRLAADLYSVGGDLHVTLFGSGELVAELDVKANVGQAQPIARWSYANAAARDAASYVSGDIGYVARVESPLGFFRLASIGPLVWELIGGGGSSGPQPVTLPAGAWIMRATDGAGVDGFEANANRQNLDEVTFAHDATEYAQATIIWPDGATTCTARVYWRATEGSGDVRWRLRARCYADDQAIDQAWGTAQSVTDTLTATGRVLISPATAAITPAGTVSGGSLCQLELDRDHTVSGNLNALARMLAVRLEFA
jgi:hypothetical protein